MTTTTTIAPVSDRTGIARTAAALAVAAARVAVTCHDINTAGLTCTELDAFAVVLMAAGQVDAAVEIVRTHAAYDMGAEGEESDMHRSEAGEDPTAWVYMYVHCLHTFTLASAVDDMASDLPSRWMVEGNVADSLTCQQVRALAGLLNVGGYADLARRVAEHHRVCCTTTTHHKTGYLVSTGTRAVTNALA